MPIGSGSIQPYSPDFSSEERERIKRVFSVLEELIRQEAQRRNIDVSDMLLLMNCDDLVVVDDESIHVVVRPSPVATFSSTEWVDERGKRWSKDEVEKIAQQNMNFEKGKTSYFCLPSQLLSYDEPSLRSASTLRQLAEEIVMKSAWASSAKSIWGDLTEFAVDLKLCFVLMPFKEEMDRLYTAVIKTAAEECGLVSKRADEIRGTREIMQDIVESICKARVIIVDLTGSNPNVFYELGIAHTLGKDTILISQKEATTIPFDIYHIRRIEYENTASGKQKLRRDLALTIKKILGTQNSP